MAVDADRVEKELTEVMNSQWFETGPFMIEFAEGRVPKGKLIRFALFTKRTNAWPKKSVTIAR